jgi:hypothetical protein
MINSFGLSLDNVIRYELDNYSTPDNWHGLGYELQYNFSAFLENIARNSECEKFIQTIIDTCLQSFNLTHDRLHYLRYVDEAQVEVLYRLIGISREEQSMQQPFRFIILIFYDKGALDIRILKKLEDEINRIAIINRVRIELTRLLIIPRSKETISAKINNTRHYEN